MSLEVTTLCAGEITLHATERLFSSMNKHMLFFRFIAHVHDKAHMLQLWVFSLSLFRMVLEAADIVKSFLYQTLQWSCDSRCQSKLDFPLSGVLDSSVLQQGSGLTEEKFPKLQFGMFLKIDGFVRLNTRMKKVKVISKSIH